MTEAGKGLPGEDTIKPPHLSQQAFSLVVNPRRACAARVTVVALSVCVCMCVCLLVVKTLPRTQRGTKVK